MPKKRANTFIWIRSGAGLLPKLLMCDIIILFSDKAF